MTNCLSAIWYSTDDLFLMMFIKRFKEFLCIATSTGGIPNNASTTEFGVLSVRP